MKHTHTESTEINFSNLEKRILQINEPFLGKYNRMKEMVYELTLDRRPTLIMATGGSKMVAYYLQLLLERLSFNGIICEVIEPRDYFYKGNRNSYSNLVVISASGKTNGIEEALANFKGKKYLVCEKEKDADYEVVAWGNELYQKEKSFISLADTLGPISLLLDTAGKLNLEIGPKEIQNINNRISELLARANSKIAGIDMSFQDTSLVQILSGYETKASSKVLESNLVESGLASTIIHDKGSFCHGRSNLLFNYPDSNVIYLTHDPRELDNILMGLIQSEYPKMSTFSTTDLDDNIFWKEYYLMLQMYFLSRKVAEDKGIDLTCPDYNPKLVRTLYGFKGEM